MSRYDDTPVQLMCVMTGGLGRAVSVSTLATAEAAPDFLAVKAATVSEYAVAGSGEERMWSVLTIAV